MSQCDDNPMNVQNQTWGCYCQLFTLKDTIFEYLGPVHMKPGQGNDCPGASVTSRSHDDLLSRDNFALGQLHCPRASSSSSDHYEFI